jgi:hypothetical protein
MRGSAGAISSREAGSGTVGHVTAPEPSLVGRRDPEQRSNSIERRGLELQDTW